MTQPQRRHIKRKHHKTSTVIIGIVVLAVAFVLVAIGFIYNKGLRYIKTDANIKFFGFLDKYGNPDEGRFWFDDGAVVAVEAASYYVIEMGNPETAADITGKIAPVLIANDGSGALDKINAAISDITAEYPNGSFIFNLTDSEIHLNNRKLSYIIKDYESLDKNNIISGSIVDSDKIEWTLKTTKTNPTSYKDFEIVKQTDSAQKYSGDIFAFLGNEKIICAVLYLKNGNVIALFGVSDVVRLDYEKGESNTDVYIGQLNRDLQKNGKGIYWYTQTSEIYTGDFDKDEYTGECSILYARGDTYSGSMVKNKREGKGISVWTDGTRYEGDFKNDLKNGEGVTTFSDGSVYTGSYINDVKQGYGRLVFSNGDIYEGNFTDDLYTGNGKYTKSSGEYYEGDFKDGIIHGEGTYHWTSGRTYTGYFDNGKMSLEKPTAE